MYGEHETRALLAPADPARDLRVAPPRLSAHDLIVVAERQVAESPRRAPRIGRRMVLASVTALAAGTAIIGLRDHDAPIARPVARGVVVQPIAFTIDERPPAAADHLRALADQAHEAPWDTMAGPYTFSHVQEWGTFGVGDENGHYKAAVDDDYTWTAPDGSGRWVIKSLPPQYRDEASRVYFESRRDILDGSPYSQGDSPPWDRPALPAGRAALSARLDVAHPITVPDRVTSLYKDYAVPRATRADVLRILAGLPGYSWRGPVVDRAGRRGVAVTYQPPYDYQDLLVFDPDTGALLAHETLLHHRGSVVSQYILILETRLTATTR